MSGKIAKFQFLQSVNANTPDQLAVMASMAFDIGRVFRAKQAPDSTTGKLTLIPDGRYNGMNSGHISSVNLSSGGAGYSVGDSFVLDTTGTSVDKIRLTVDSTRNGAITDFQLSHIGEYSTYPTNLLVTAPTGGATFSLSTPPPDVYFDITDATAPVMYVCVKGGMRAAATWKQVSGSGSGGNWNYRGIYNPATTSPYVTFDVVQYNSGTSAGMYMSLLDGNLNAPDSGLGWIQIATGSGVWL